jgi:predicted lipoprotein with Yx(FWY)xxD motif
MTEMSPVGFQYRKGADLHPTKHQMARRRTMKRGYVLFPLSIFLAMAFMSPAAYSQWSTNPAVGNPITTAAGNAQNLQTVSDGSGGAIAAWVDFENGNYSIDAQRINSVGQVQWTTNGVAVCAAPDIRLYPTLISDGAGGAIITWEDHRNGLDYDIYAQRISSSGAVQWTPNGVAIDTLTGNQELPTIVGDGAGGAIITWQDLRNGVDYDIYAQRVSSSGAIQWAPNGVVVDTSTGYQMFPTLVSDGSGGAIITWQDGRNGVDNDIYAQRVNASGIVQWSPGGVPIDTLSGNQQVPVIVGDGSGGAIITWQDYRNGADYDIYAQRVNSTGVVQWTANGVAVSTVTNNQTSPAIVSDGAGGAVITWTDLRTGTSSDIYAQRIKSSGVVQWVANGVPICTAAGSQESAQIVGDGFGGAIITWEDLRNGSDFDIYAQHVDATGGPQWTTNGVPICTAVNAQQYPVIVPDGFSGALIAWVDAAPGVYAYIFAMRLDRHGHPFGENPSITLAGDVANDQGGQMRILWKPSTLDVVPDTTIHSYTIKMGVKSTGLLGKSSFVKKNLKTTEATGDTIYWQIAATVPANWSAGYNALVTTTADSGPQGIPWYYFQVIANSADPASSWPSNIDSGYSVDNLPPGAPAALTARVVNDTVGLAWEAVSAPDLWGYDIYRSTSSMAKASFSSLNPYATSTLPAYIDSSPLASGPSYYVVLAKISTAT